MPTTTASCHMFRKAISYQQHGRIMETQGASSRRDFLRAAGLGLAGACLLSRQLRAAEVPPDKPAHQAAGAASVPAKRPNIVFILADDMGYGDLSCRNSLADSGGAHEVLGSGVRYRRGCAASGPWRIRV